MRRFFVTFLLDNLLLNKFKNISFNPILRLPPADISNLGIDNLESFFEKYDTSQLYAALTPLLLQILISLSEKSKPGIPLG